MYEGKLVFAQLMDHLPLQTFRRCVARYAGRYAPLSFSHLDQILSMAFAQGALLGEMMEPEGIDTTRLAEDIEVAAGDIIFVPERLF